MHIFVASVETAVCGLLVFCKKLCLSSLPYRKYFSAEVWTSHFLHFSSGKFSLFWGIILGIVRNTSPYMGKIHYKYGKVSACHLEDMKSIYKHITRFFDFWNKTFYILLNFVAYFFENNCHQVYWWLWFICVKLKWQNELCYSKISPQYPNTDEHFYSGKKDHGTFLLILEVWDETRVLLRWIGMHVN